MPPSGYIPSDKREYLSSVLAQHIPPGAKLAFCCDPEGDFDEIETVADSRGRIFRVLTYREDDLAFRLRLHKLKATRWSAKRPILIRAAMPEFAPRDHRINLSPVADVIAMVEGQAIDLRTDAVVTHYTEPVVWPDSLQGFAKRIGGNLPAFVNGYWRMRETISVNRPLARHHIAAALLLASYPNLRYQDMDIPTAYTAEVVARALALSVRFGFSDEDRQLLQDVLRATSYQGDPCELDPWFALPVDEAARLVVLGDFLYTLDIPML
jgi:hypothetical protein